MDKRNWKEYNEHLIKRGTFYINPEFLSTWMDEINKMNSRKVGQPYLYPNSMIEFLAILHCKGFDYRALQGMMIAFSKNLGHFPVISYSQISRRVNSLEFNFEASGENLIVAGDGSGMKISNRGEWMRHKWRVQRGWIKVVILGTTQGKIVDIRIGTEYLEERKAVRGMIRTHHKKIKKILLDGLHDCKATFNLCEQYGIETAIKIRKNARTRSFNSPRRRKEVVEYKQLGHEQWVKKKDYGMRWPASEGIFSSTKRIFRETVNSTNKINMYKEVRRKFWAYNKLKEVG